MSHRALGAQFKAPKDHILVKRGLVSETPESFDTENLGVHWTTDKRVAKRFALGIGVMPENWGVVLLGAVHKDHVVTPDSPDYEDNYRESGGSDENEREVRVRSGSPVQVLGYQRVSAFNKDFADPDFVPFDEPRAGTARPTTSPKRMEVGE